MRADSRVHGEGGGGLAYPGCAEAERDGSEQRGGGGEAENGEGEGFRGVLIYKPLAIGWCVGYAVGEI